MTDAPQTHSPPFIPADLKRQLLIDTVLRWMVALGVIGGLLIGLVWEDTGAHVLSLVVIMVVAGGWVAVSLINARVAQQLPMLTAAVYTDPPRAEAGLAAAIRRRPLQRRVRLLLFHRLAMLRHRQQRFAETAAICQTVLAQPMRRSLIGFSSINDVRNNLLLMLAEARLQCKDVVGSYVALTELAQSPLSLLESLQRVALQTQYEIAAGYPQAVMQGLEGKVLLAELMPAAQSGAVHAMFAVAAAKVERHDIADWLRRRAELLCTPQQIEHFGQFAGLFADLHQPEDFIAEAATPEHPQ